jgi:hypothetical protein
MRARFFGASEPAIITAVPPHHRRPTRAISWASAWYPGRAVSGPPRRPFPAGHHRGNPTPITTAQPSQPPAAGHHRGNPTPITTTQPSQPPAAGHHRGNPTLITTAQPSRWWSADDLGAAGKTHPTQRGATASAVSVAWGAGDALGGCGRGAGVDEFARGWILCLTVRGRGRRPFGPSVLGALRSCSDPEGSPRERRSGPQRRGDMKILNVIFDR